jgi:outer membrane protein assembly factor BamB
VIVIGNQSVVAQGAKKAELKCHPVCELTDVEGNTTVTASFVARADDSAKGMKDIGGRKLLFGIAEADRNYQASVDALQTAAIKPGTTENRSSYSDAALDVLDSRATPTPVAVIPSYALRLLEGCGSLKPGSLKVLGKTAPVPFITVFLGDAIPAKKQQKIVETLLGIKRDPKLLKAIESRDGFKPIQTEADARSTGMIQSSWPDWRGPNRDGHVPRLPSRLPATAKVIWKKGAREGGLAGLSVSDHRLLLAERDFEDAKDVYRCLNADTGELLWLAQFAAPGKLDYGQSPRATPVIYHDKVYLLGAFGGLRCVDFLTGKVIWARDLSSEFNAKLPTWGMCCTPLIVGDLVVVNPGGAKASLVALDCITGKTRWVTPGAPAAYSAFIFGNFGSRQQIIGYDQGSLGGWDAGTGRRLWQLVPPAEGDFNVPTPVGMDGGVIVSTENNGTRLYHFDDTGRIIAKPRSQSAELSPTTSTPVVTCGRVFGAHQGLHCLDARAGLRELWHRDEDLGDHATFFADENRVLVITISGELILLDARADQCVILSRLRMFEDDAEVYSHPALVGTRLYARGGSSVLCMDLRED